MYVSVLFCERMNYNESIFFYNMRRYASYTGYSATLCFKEAVSIEVDNEVRKDIISMDALKFTKANKDSQYKISNILRDLNKAFVAYTPTDQTRHLSISSGKWGCGAFGGDPQLKYLIQWLAASAQKRPLIFNTFQEIDKLEKVNEVTKMLSTKTIGEVYAYLREYSQGFQQFNVFDSIMQMVKKDEDKEF